jgi:hypothetical protein
MSRQSLAVIVMLGLGLLLGCASDADPEILPSPSLDQMPLMLAGPLFTAGYELASYHDLDTDGDGVVEALAVLTLEESTTNSSTGSSYVLLFGQHGGAWSLNDRQRLSGVNASAELEDVTDDGLPELLVHTEEADTQLGDFVTPLRRTDQLSIFTYTASQYLAKLGTFTSSLSGQAQPRSTIVDWDGKPAIQTTQDLPPKAQSLWRPVRIETFAWDGQNFARVNVEEQRRISPVVTWLMRRNAPWLALFSIVGVAAGAAMSAITRRRRLKERWSMLGAILLFVLGAILLFVLGGVGLGLATEWMCVPALVLAGLAAFGFARQVVKHWGDNVDDGE